MALTELAVKRLAKKGTRYEVQDAGGLYLRVAPSGLKNWMYRYYFDGRSRRVNLGKWPGIGIAEARKRASESMKQVQQGIDPGQAARENPTWTWVTTSLL